MRSSLNRVEAAEGVRSLERRLSVIVSFSPNLARQAFEAIAADRTEFGFKLRGMLFDMGYDFVSLERYIYPRGDLPRTVVPLLYKSGIVKRLGVGREMFWRPVEPDLYKRTELGNRVAEQLRDFSPSSED